MAEIVEDLQTPLEKVNRESEQIETKKTQFIVNNN